MKNLQTYEEFLNEAKILSPKMIKDFDLNKNSVNDLKKYSYKLGKDYLKITGGDYFGDKSYVIQALVNVKDRVANNNYSWSAERFNISYGDWNGQLTIDNTISNVKINNNYIYIPVSDVEIGIQIDKVNGDVIKGLINFLDASFKKYGSEIEAHILEMTGLEVLYVIKAGEISPATGKTGHGWSIYDNNPRAKLAWGGGWGLMYGGGLEIGKSYKILDDQKHTVISDKFTVKELIDCNYKDYVAFSRRTGAKVPVGAYQKQPGSYAYTLYSIK